MRIAHVTDRISERGGADVHLLGVVRGQLEAGHEVRLVAGTDDGTAPIAEKRILIRGLELGRGPLPSSTLGALDAATRSVDVVHVHNALHPDVMAWAGARHAVATVQDHRSFCPGRGKLMLDGSVCTLAMERERCAACFDDADYRREIFTVTERRLAALERMSAITVLSHYVKRELVAAGLDPDTVVVIPPFVYDLDVTAAPEGAPCVLFVGRLVAPKGVLDAIDAHERSEVRLPLVFAGTGPLRNQIERHEVLGWRPHRSLGAVYRRARALLMPSRWQEPFGIAGIEALACGVPVVAYDSGGIREWHPTPELLVRWGDLDALATALRAAVAREQTPLAFPAEPAGLALEGVYLRKKRR